MEMTFSMSSSDALQIRWAGGLPSESRQLIEAPLSMNFWTNRGDLALIAQWIGGL